MRKMLVVLLVFSIFVIATVIFQYTYRPTYHSLLPLRGVKVNKLLYKYEGTSTDGVPINYYALSLGKFPVDEYIHSRRRMSGEFQKGRIQNDAVMHIIKKHIPNDPACRRYFNIDTWEKTNNLYYYIYSENKLKFVAIWVIDPKEYILYYATIGQ